MADFDFGSDVKSTVQRTVDNIAASYVRERHLAPLLPAPWGDTLQIVERLERALKGAQRALIRNHWTADINRVFAIRGALLAERRKLVREIEEPEGG